MNTGEKEPVKSYLMRNVNTLDSMKIINYNTSDRYYSITELYNAIRTYKVIIDRALCNKPKAPLHVGST